MMLCNFVAAFFRGCRIRLCQALMFDYKHLEQNKYNRHRQAPHFLCAVIFVFCCWLVCVSAPNLDFRSDAFATRHPSQHYILSSSNSELVSFAYCGQSSTREYLRIGEASHPGPFVISTFNPTQLLGHEQCISQWNRGIWTGCETSHTHEAMMISKARFHKNDIYSRFSSPVEKHSSNAGTLRGKAAGTVILSNFPVKPYPGKLPEAVDKAARFVDALVHIGQGTQVYIGTVYGPPTANMILSNGEEVFVEAALTGVDRATKFKGPAAITGDFNRDLDSVSFWPFLQQQGWHDAAILAWQRFGTEPENTCKDVSRRSFVLVNSELARALNACHVAHKHTFDSHPVLEAVFDIDTCLKPKLMWS